MPDDFQSLLPSNSTPWERAVEQTSGERWDDFDVDVIRRARDPWTCPKHLLPFLAFERSVDIWSDKWPEFKQRSVIASAPADHKIKTTEAGIRRYLHIADAELLHVRTPPSGYRMGRSMTPQEREQWLAQYPEIRVYRARRRFDMNGLVLGRSFLKGRSSHGPSFMAPDNAEAYAVPQAYLYDRGIETKLTTYRREPLRRKAVVEEAIEVRIPKALGGLVLGRSFIGGQGVHGPSFFQKDDAAYRVYTLVTREQQEIANTSRLAIDIARPDMEPLDVRSQFVRERFTVKGLLLGRRRIGVAYLVPDRAVDHIYTRTRLYDPNRPLPRRSGGGAVIGRDYINIAHHTARMRVSIREKQPRRAFVVGGFLRGFIPPHQDEAYKLAFQAIRSAKRLSDKTLVETRTMDHATISNGLAVGTFTIGEMRKVI